MLTEIVTERLRMRRARPDDLDALHALVSNYEMVKTTGTWPWPPQRDFTLSRCKPMNPADGMGGPIFCGDVMIGSMGLQQAALGYSLGRAFWGKGYATEMARALIDHGFATYDWPQIIAFSYEDNPASARVLTKLGFEPGALRQSPCAARGGTWPARRYTLDRPQVA